MNDENNTPATSPAEGQPTPVTPTPEQTPPATVEGDLGNGTEASPPSPSEPVGSEVSPSSGEATAPEGNAEVPASTPDTPSTTPGTSDQTAEPTTGTETASAETQGNADTDGIPATESAPTEASSNSASASTATVSVSGAESGTVTVAIGVTVSDALKAAGIKAPSSFTIRDAVGKEIPTTSKVPETGLNLTLVRKARGG